MVDEKPGDITFRTTQPLGPYEGLTVAVGFPKGVVGEPSEGSAPPTGWRTTARRWSPSSGCLACASFYYFAWRRAGRDPRAGTVVPIFSPPDGLSPAGMRYVAKMNADDRAFAAALVDMGVRGHVKHCRGRRRLVLGDKTRTRATREPMILPQEEQAALVRSRPGELSRWSRRITINSRLP